MNFEKNVKLLIVDDDHIFCNIVKNKISEIGLDCHVAYNGEEAIDILENNNDVELIISDLEMPKINGFELIEYCRGTKKYRSIPIIVITGAEESNIVDKAFKAGATNFMTKPVNWKMFNESVKFMLKSWQNEKKLLQATVKLKNANSFKDDLISIMSHEMRTPLNYIIGFGEVLYGKLADKEQREYAKYVIDGGKKLLSNFSDILLISNSKSSGIEISKSEISVKEFLDMVLSKFKSKIEEKQLKLETALFPDESKIINIDVEKIELAFGKLIDNAIKFSDENGNIKIYIYSEENKTSFIVIDEGSGIDDELKKVLGNEFLQKNYSFSRDNEGLGLGVSVAMQIAKSHDGCVTFSNNEKRGTVACLTINFKDNDKINLDKQKNVI